MTEVVEDPEEDGTSSEEVLPPGRSPWPLLMGVAGVMLACGTYLVLGSNSERERQAQQVRDAQSRMEVLH